MRVLILDDDAATLRLVEQVVRNYGHEPVPVAHPSELDTLDAPPDAAVIDWHLDDQTCEAAIDQLRQRYAKLPVMIMTADSDLDLIQRALEHGARCWWLKNTGIENLRRQLADLVQAAGGSSAHPVAI